MLHDRHCLQLGAWGYAALLPGQTTITCSHLHAPNLYSAIFIVKPLDPVIEVIDFHLLHFPLGGGLLAGYRSCQTLVRGSLRKRSRCAFALVVDSRAWDRGGTELVLSSVAGHQGPLEGTVDIYSVGRQGSLQRRKVP